MLTQRKAARILGKAFWLTLLEPTDPDVLRELGSASDNWGGELWIMVTSSVDEAEGSFRSVEHAFGPDAGPPIAACEAMATVFDDRPVWWLAPQRGADEARRVVESGATAVGWRLADEDAAG